MALTVLILLMTAGFALAAAFYLGRRKAVPAAFFICVRFLLAAALLCAFFEPVLKFERLDTKRPAVPVLVDASMSMRLFDPRSSVLPFLRMLDSLQQASPASLAFKFYFFGDSLRGSSLSRIPGFSDLHSFLPAAITEKAIHDAQVVLIVSDGNLSNLSSPKGILQEKSCYYLKLPPASPLPFLQSDLISSRESVPLDSPAAAVLQVHGFFSKQQQIQLSCRQGVSPVAQRSIKVDSGYFSDTVTFRLPTSRQGRSVYAVSACNAADSLRTDLFFTQTVIPQQLRAKIISISPLLDRRFLTLALENDAQWRIAGPESKEYDALFLFDFNESTSQAFASLHPKGIVVFLGALPCSSRVDMAPASFSLISTSPYDTLANRIISATLAPPSQIQVCIPPFLVHSRVALASLVQDENSRNKPPDTIPFITVGSFKGRSAIAVAGRGLWRADFLPLSVARESETPAMMQFIAAFVKNQLLENLRENLAVYPSAAELYENDSLPFSALLPPDFSRGGPFIESPAAKNSFAVRCVVDSGGKKILDSLYNLTGLVQRDKASFVLPPLAAGAYHYTCSMAPGQVQRHCSDSFYVSVNRQELSVAGQNTVLLDEFALPLSSAEPKAVLQVYAANSLGRRATVTQNLELRQGWVLLSIILSLFTLEWLARRRKGLD
ncbi:MAG TPA: hypothetical protein VLX68_02035 [Chitinivibrionales bacterium]|nr:hypothetical protein [Chitinivibrionales bacterium]